MDPRSDSAGRGDGRGPDVRSVHRGPGRPDHRRELQAACDPHRSFEFGLDRLLDGIGVLIADTSR